MAKIKAPNENYCGVTATVVFVNGKDETDNEHLIEWFKEHNYKVEVEEVQEKTEIKEEVEVEEAEIKEKKTKK